MPDVAVETFSDEGAVAIAAGPELYYELRGLSPCSRVPGP